MYEFTGIYRVTNGAQGLGVHCSGNEDFETFQQNGQKDIEEKIGVIYYRHNVY